MDKYKIPSQTYKDNQSEHCVSTYIIMTWNVDKLNQNKTGQNQTQKTNKPRHKRQQKPPNQEVMLTAAKRFYHKDSHTEMKHNNNMLPSCQVLRCFSSAITLCSSRSSSSTSIPGLPLSLLFKTAVYHFSCQCCTHTTSRYSVCVSLLQRMLQGEWHNFNHFCSKEQE